MTRKQRMSVVGITNVLLGTFLLYLEKSAIPLPYFLICGSIAVTMALLLVSLIDRFIIVLIASLWIPLSTMVGMIYLTLVPRPPLMATVFIARHIISINYVEVLITFSFNLILLIWMKRGES